MTPTLEVITPLIEEFQTLSRIADPSATEIDRLDRLTDVMFRALPRLGETLELYYPGGPLYESTREWSADAVFLEAVRVVCGVAREAA